jgi:hypothetical protein
MMTWHTLRQDSSSGFAAAEAVEQYFKDKAAEGVESDILASSRIS